MKTLVLLASVIALAVAGSTSAQAVRSMSSGASINRAHPRPPAINEMSFTDKDGKICQYVLKTGSRLGEFVVCATKAEWSEMAHAARVDTERHQINVTKDPG